MPEWLLVEPVSKSWLESQLVILGWLGYREEKTAFVGTEIQVNVRAVMQ
jgi:hypothetical protein